MLDGPELDRFIQHIGEKRAREIASSAHGGFLGISKAAFKGLAEAAAGYAGPSGKPENARAVLLALMERFGEEQ